VRHAQDHLSVAGLLWCNHGLQIVLTAPALALPGGVQSYALTVAGQLERLGHDVTLFAPIQGLVADVARERGLRVARSEHDLPEACDAILAQDAPTLLTAAAHYPKAVRALVIHGAEYDLHLPPPPAGAAAVVIALNDVTARRARAVADAPPVIRLRQPIDTARFGSHGALRETPGRVLLLGNDLRGARRDALLDVCDRAGVAVAQVGQHGELRADAAAAICEADIVIGRGRSVLEAMSCGRAAYVLGPVAGDGWVTPSSYPGLEADGFRGRATDAVPDAGDFARALTAYDPRMGERNRALVVQHHDFHEHAAAVVEALGAVEPQPLPDAPLRELARLVRITYDAQVRVTEIGHDLRAAHLRNDSLTAELEAARRAGDERAAEIGRLREQLAGIVGSRRWQAASAVARPVDRLRSRR
jgi:hypothetical protein